MLQNGTTRLSLLMDSFNVTGRELAEVLHVDFSLVSKWRNNKRPLSRRSVHLKRIARYFLALDAPNKYTTLKGILRNYFPDAGLDSPEALLECLSQWLSAPWFSSGDEDRILVSTQRSGTYAAGFEVYSGDKGRRKAVLKFLDAVLALPGGQNLLLVSEEDMSWLVGDPVFLQAWKERLVAVLMKKNKITIIHTVDREYQALAAILGKWLPLHLTGMIESYYFPKYVDKSLKTTLFILKDKFAVTGMTVEGWQKTCYTSFFSDAVTVKQCELIFRAFVSECRPLFEIFWPDRLQQLFQKLNAAELQEGDSYLFSPIPSFGTMSRDTLMAVLEENNLDAERSEKCLAYHEKINKGFLKNLAKHFHRHILVFDLLEQVLLGNKIVYADLSQIIGREVRASAKNFSRHIHDTIAVLENYPNFDIALIPSKPAGELQGISIWTKENTITLAYTNVKKEKAPLGVLTSEPTIVNAFFQYHDHLWQSISRVNRSKDWVKTKLSNICETEINKNASG